MTWTMDAKSSNNASDIRRRTDALRWDTHVPTDGRTDDDDECYRRCRRTGVDAIIRRSDDDDESGNRHASGEKRGVSTAERG